MNIFNRRHWLLRLEWRCWAVGVMAPHAGMVVWTVFIGPLSVQFWPDADEDYKPF